MKIGFVGLLILLLIGLKLSGIITVSWLVLFLSIIGILIGAFLTICVFLIMMAILVDAGQRNGWK